VALVVGLLAGAGGAYALVRGLAAPTYPALSYGAGGDVPVFDVSANYCYEVTPSPGHSVDGSSRSCQETHEIEIISTLDTYGSSYQVAYPGKEALSAYGQGGCAMYFDTIVAGDDKDKLTISVLVPSQQAFEENTASPGSSSPTYQSRTIYCVLHAADGSQLTGSRVVKQPGS
jgi:hypothetical protein